MNLDALLAHARALVGVELGALADSLGLRIRRTSALSADNPASVNRDRPSNSGAFGPLPGRRSERVILTAPSRSPSRRDPMDRIADSARDHSAPSGPATIASGPLTVVGGTVGGPGFATDENSVTTCCR